MSAPVSVGHQAHRPFQGLAGSVVRITITSNLILHFAAFLSGDTPDL